MKVRSRMGEIKNVEALTIVSGKDVYCFSDETWGFAKDFEPVPAPPTWRDVTDVTVTDAIGLWAPEHHRIARVENSYRLRKVKVQDWNEVDLNFRWAFIVEQQQ